MHIIISPAARVGSPRARRRRRHRRRRQKARTKRAREREWHVQKKEINDPPTHTQLAHSSRQTQKKREEEIHGARSCFSNENERRNALAL